MVVGDEDQSIYGFRHADIRNILDFEHDFPDAEVVKLEQNYRSTQTILSAANAVVERNRERRPKELWTDIEGGELVQLSELGDEHEEARWVAAEIERLGEEHGVKRADVAVFYRTNAMSRVLEDTLVRYEVPYQVIGGTKFYDRAEVKDAVAYLSLLLNPADQVSFLRVVNSPRRGIGNTTQGRLASYANTAGLTIWEVAERAEEVPGLSAAAIKAVGRFFETMDLLKARVDSGAAVADVVQAVLSETRLRGSAGGRAHGRSRRADREPRRLHRGRRRVRPQPRAGGRERAERVRDPSGVRSTPGAPGRARRRPGRAAAGRAQPAPARGGRPRRGAAAGPGRRRLGQDPGPHPPDRLSAGDRRRAAGGDPRDHLHQQGRGGDARAGRRT